MTWTVEGTHDHVTHIKIPYIRRKEWEQWVLLSSDRHHDNPKCRQDLELRHLEEAKARNAPVIDCGDLFCAMQGKYDKRSSKDAVRPEHQNGRYLDSLVDTAAEFYGPYAKQFVVIGQGNHETGIRKNHEISLTDRLVDRLNRDYGGNVAVGGYSGWVRFQFACDINNRAIRSSMFLYYNHGYGGGGPVTKDVIQASRRAAYLPDANIVVSGHTHDQWTFSVERERITREGQRYRDTQVHIKTPTYKDAWDLAGGFEQEKGHPPKPIGACWLRFHFFDRPDGEQGIDFDTIWAK